ncbi:hypothetical protein XANCAGTX0491_005597 [Xanthoria calcicola]
MRPLRLQIVVQPRVSSSPATPASSEPSIKWLEVCSGNPTIQELSETLEKRFLQRNHTTLNIKILKCLDDVELFPDCKVRDIFDDIKEVKQGYKDLSIVKVYRNPPTTLELADPRRFDSLPPDSFARPIKRPLSPYLRPPPPPLFADATRNEAHNTSDRPDPQDSPFEDQTPAPNKRQKIHAHGSNAYKNDPDQPIDSREVADHDYGSSQTVRRHSSQEPQVEDSQTSPRNKRSDPYGTPVSSHISHPEHKRTCDAEMVSVPDSPPDRVTLHGRDSVRLGTVDSDSRLSSPELPISLGRSSQLQETLTRVRSSNPLPQARQSLKTPVESQAWPMAQLPVSRKIVSPSGKPDFWSELEEAERDQRFEPSEATQTASRMMNPKIPSKGSTLSRSNSAAQAQPLLGNSKSKASQSHGDIEKGGRLKRPNGLKSALAPSSAPKLINGIRQKAPSIMRVSDPIETSEGSSYERQLPRSLKRARTSMPKRNLREAASQKAASQKSLIVRLRAPQAMQQRSSAVSSPEVSQVNMTVDAQGTGKSAPTQESGSQAADGEVQNRSVDMPHTAITGDQANHSSSPVAASTEEAQSLTKLTKLDPDPSPHGINDQTNATIPPVQRTLVLPNEYAVDTASTSHGLEVDTGDESLAGQLKEAQEVKEKAQAEFDRITALKKKRQSLQASKAGPLVAASPVTLAVVKEPTPPALALCDKAQRPCSSDDLEAKRKYGLEQLASTRNKFFKDIVSIDTSYSDEEKKHQAATKPKASEAQAKAKKRRRAKEQKDKEARMIMAKKIEEERRSEIEEANTERVKTRSEQMRPTSKPKDVNLAQQQEVDLDHVTHPKRTAEGQWSQEAFEQTPESQRREDHLPEKVAAEAARAKRNEAKSMVPKEPTLPDSSLGKLAERSPKHPNKDFERTKTPAARAASNGATTTVPARKVQQNTGVKQAAKKTRGNTQEPNGQCRSQAGNSASHVDAGALRAARAAGLPVARRFTTTASNGSDTAAAKLDTPKATAVDLAGDAPTRLSKEPLRRSPSSSTTRSEPSRARTMTPAIPGASIPNFPNSAEARARRAASVSMMKMKTPTRNVLPAKMSASGSSVSFAGASLTSKLHNGKTADQKLTPTPSGPSSRMNQLGKTPPEKTKQTTMTRHIDRKLKGKMIDPPAQTRAPIEKNIIISSDSEASTFYSDESEGQRNGRSGPSSRKKPKPRNSSSISESAIVAGNSGATYTTTTKASTHPAAQFTSGRSSQLASQPVKSPGNSVDQVDGAKPSHTDRHPDAESDFRSSRSASAASTDDVSNLPQIGGATVRPESLARDKNDSVLQTSKPLDEVNGVTAQRVKDEERLQLEANEQLQRENSQAMQATVAMDLQPSETDSFKQVTGQSRQTQPAVRAEKYGSRVRVNPTYGNVSLSQLVKAQASEPMVLNGSAKEFPSPKPTDQPMVESSSASDSEESSSSESVDLLKKAHDTGLSTTPLKKSSLSSVFRDLYGREASRKRYQ